MFFETSSLNLRENNIGDQGAASLAETLKVTVVHKTDYSLSGLPQEKRRLSRQYYCPPS